MAERLIALATVGRSDYSIYKPILRVLARCHDVQYGLLVSGGHLSPEQGLTVRQIEEEGEPILDRVPMLLAADDPPSIAIGMGLGSIGFAQALSRIKPHLLVVLGDRSEMHAAASAAVPLTIPIAHIHGGEITEGAIDDRFRHSITKLSHLHFVSTEKAAVRVVQMGEEPWRVIYSGAPSLDNLSEVPPLDRATFFARLDWKDPGEFILATYHPVTMEPGHEGWQINELLEALSSFGKPVLFTLANADAGGHTINAAVNSFVAQTTNARLIPNLGNELYFSAMAHAAAMVGNSSSGIVEAASFALPVANIGIRQRGRERGPNVVDSDNGRAAILATLTQICDPKFRSSLIGMKNIYGDGQASHRIVDKLRTIPIDELLLRKRFFDAEIQRS